MIKKINEKTRILAAIGFLFLAASNLYVYFTGMDRSVITILGAAACIGVSIYEVKRVSEIRKNKKN